jgi:hypothetical protein
MRTEKVEAKVILSIISGKLLTKDSEAIKNALNRLTGYGAIPTEDAIKAITGSYPALGSNEMLSAIESIPKILNQANIDEWLTEFFSGKFGVVINEDYFYIELLPVVAFGKFSPPPETSKQNAKAYEPAAI